MLAETCTLTYFTMAVAIATVVPSSAAPALSLLDEREPVLQAHALRSLDALADSFWPEISGAVDKIQELSEDEMFPDKNLAAIVAAKVNFHLGSLDEALHYALSAGSFFDVDAQTEFANTLRARCIDDYITFKVSQSDANTLAAGSSSGHAFALELESVVERVLNGCIQKGEICEAIGVSLESRRLDKVELAILEGCKTDSARAEALAYCFECAQTLVASRSYRAKVLNLIASIHLKHFTPENRNYIAVSNCLAFVGDAQGVTDVLMSLVSDAAVSGKDNESDLELTALQIAFDIVDNDAPFFAAKVATSLPPARVSAPPAPVQPSAPEASAAASNAVAEPATGAPTPMDTDIPAVVPDAPVTGTTVASASELTKEEAKVAKLREILNGNVTSALSLDFLCSQNHSDTYLLKRIKSALDARSSVSHSALVFSNAIAHSGTAIDRFLRDNLEWLSRATSWAKFSATSCLGVIHARHTSAALNLLSPYLPSAAGGGGAPSASSYSEGGALYALGLIAATGGRDVELPAGPSGTASSTAKSYLLQSLQTADSNEVVKHGASLGLGLSGMASWEGDENEDEHYEELKALLYTDSAVASEAAGLGMGLIALGSGSRRVCDEMLAYAHETEHEKIIRGLAMGIALVCYGREDDADDIIEMLKADKNPILRYGAMYAVGLAYCGTADNKAIRLLLHYAVSDVSDDVRRSAVIALGFVMFRHPKQLPRIVALLAESCHAHVRYGAAMAIGIACMGTGMPVAVEMLERLTADPSDFVRQGALIGLALVYMHHTEERSPKSAETRKIFETTWSAKLEDAVTRFGAVVAAGIIDAGGRNGAIALTSATGHPRMSAIVGLALFTQFWYWYPMVHFIGLSIKPAALIAVNQDLKMPKMKVQCNTAPDMYAYVPSGPPEKQKEATRAPTAVLSVTAKSKARELRRAAKKKAAEGGGDTGAQAPGTPSASDATMTDAVGAVADGGDGKGTDKDVITNKPAATSTVLENPCRVLAAQEKYISWDVIDGPEMTDGDSAPSKRYLPVVTDRKSGIVVMRDLKRGEPEEFVEMRSLATATPPSATAPTTPAVGAVMDDDDADDDGAELTVPEPFVYTDEIEATDSDAGGAEDAAKAE